MMSRFSVKKRIITIVLAALFLLCFSGLAFAGDPVESFNTETQDTMTAEKSEADGMDETDTDGIPEDNAGESAFVALEEPSAGEADASADAVEEETVSAEEVPAETKEDDLAGNPEQEEPAGPGEALGEEETVTADTEEPEETGEFRYSAITADGLTKVTVTGNDINVRGVRITSVTDSHLEDLAVETAGLNNSFGKSVSLFDIVLTDENGLEIEPVGQVNVILENPGFVQNYENDLYLVHFAADSSGILVSDISVSDNQIAFDTDGFSVYAVVSTDGSEKLQLGDFLISVPGENLSQKTEEDLNAICMFNEDTGVLTVYKDVTIEMGQDAGGQPVANTSNRIVIAKDCKVTLNGVSITAADNSAMIVDANAKAELILNGSNTLKGAQNFAGLEVAWESDSVFSDLTIKGSGVLQATGKGKGAGIGGKNQNSVYGNITISLDEGGKIIAGDGTGSGAGIGSGATDRGSNQPAAKKWGTITINSGTVEAVANGGQASGIGGGNHVSSGKIIINGGTITATGYSGIGSGLGGSKHINGDPGPGSIYADVEINGGNITARGSDTGAGIGGAMYCDAIINITGGIVHAYSGPGRNNATHGGAAIGGGYQGHAAITIEGGEVYAYGAEGSAGAGIGSGTAANSSSKHTNDGRNEMSKLEKSSVTITGGQVYAYGGGYGGAGIGNGSGSDAVEVTISGGSIYSAGGKSTEESLSGGAGIGSAYAGAPAAEFDDNGEWTQKYFVLTDTKVSITGGNIVAIGGWGASGIGSGAENKTADSITIDAENSDIEAYADGTKFAIDTRQLKADGNTDSIREGRDIAGNMLQGTFVHAGQIGDYEQNPEGLKSIIVSNDRDSAGFQQELKLMPDGYRSFAIDVPEAGSYTVYTDESSIGHGEGRFFNKCDVEYFDESRITARNIQYEAKEGELCDNFYLYPVKSIEIKKSIAADDSVMDKINLTLYFAVQEWSEDHNGKFLTNPDGSKMLKTIEIVKGIPQSNAFFVDIEDKQYEIWEMDENGNSMEQGTKFDSVVLKRIETRHGEGDDNNAVIDEDTWTDTVTVINTFELTDPPVDPDEPSEDPDEPSVDPVPDDGPAPEPPVKPDPQKEDASPDTGDNSLISTYVIIAVAAGAVAVILGIRRRNYSGRHAR